MLRITRALKTFKCVSCGYSTKMRNVRILFSSHDLDEARSYLISVQSKGSGA